VNSALLLIPDSRLALWCAMALVATGRQFVYSTFFAQLQHLATPNTYGVLAGVANLYVASTGLLQPSLVTLATKTCAGWGEFSFAPVNLIMITLMLLLLTQPLRCWRDPQPQVAPKLPTPSAASMNADLLGSASTLRVSLLHA